MTILIYDMDVSSIIKSGIFKQNGLQDFLFSSSEYKTIAKKMIYRYASREASIRMLEDDDAIYFVSHKLIMASCQWYKSNRNYTHRGYLSRHGKWAIQTWSTKKEEIIGREWNNISLSDIKNNENERTVEDITVDTKEVCRKKQLDDNKNIKRLMECANLSNRQIRFIHMRYWDNMSNAQIARQECVTRERIRQIINLALQHLSEVKLGILE